LELVPVEAQEQSPAQRAWRRVRVLRQTEARTRTRAVALIEQPIFRRSAGERPRSIARYLCMTSGGVSFT
jgi:hypothetical protein